jgi:hypothetical protein
VLGLSILALAPSATAAVYPPPARANILESTIIEPAQWGHRGFYARPYAVRPYGGYRPYCGHFAMKQIDKMWDLHSDHIRLG